MEVPYHFSPPIIDVLHACPAICARLGPQNLACLALCSSSLRAACEAAAVRDALQLLKPAIMASNRRQLHEHHQQAAVWLARLLQRTAAAATAAAAVARQLICLPSVGLSWAVQLVAAGVRIWYAQLLDAASSSLAGVEVWVQAQQQLGVQTDIPAVAVTVCCGDEWVSGSWAVSDELRCLACLLSTSLNVWCVAPRQHR
jgi:hypothetical protein